MKKHLSLCLLTLIPSIAYADLPLQVEDMLSDKGKMRFELSTTYANSERRSVDTPEAISIQTGETTYINIPTKVGERLSNTDAFVTTAGFRYGLTSKTALYARASALHVEHRSENSEGTVSNDSTSNFADAWVGLNHKFRDDIDKPALFGFAELQIAEHQEDDKNVYGKALVIGGTTYQTFDPLVLSMTGAVQLYSTRDVNNESYQPGNSLTLSPSVGFAVNEKITLTGGVSWRFKESDEINGEKIGIKQTQTSLDLGLGYAFGKHDTVSINARPKVSGDGDIQINVGWIHRLKN